jgi:hypothetical protein
MTPIKQESATGSQMIMSPASLWKYLCVNLALPNAVVNIVINVVIGLAFFWKYSEIGIYSGDNPLLPDIIISTFISIFIVHLASIKLSSRYLESINMTFPPAKDGLAAFFGSGNSLLHRIRGGIVLGLLWGLTAATITFVICAAFDVQKAAFADVIKMKIVVAFLIGYIQSILSGYANVRGRTFAHLQRIPIRNVLL